MKFQIFKLAALIGFLSFGLPGLAMESNEQIIVKHKFIELDEFGRAINPGPEAKQEAQEQCFATGGIVKATKESTVDPVLFRGRAVGSVVAVSVICEIPGKSTD